MGLKVLGTGLIALSLVACSSRPPPPAPAAPEAAPAAASSAAAKSATAAPVASAAELAAAGVNVDRAYLKAGYKPTMYKGQLFYCRTVDVTGTSFKKKVCMDEAHMKEEARKTQEMQDSILRQRTNPGCAPPACS